MDAAHLHLMLTHAPLFGAIFGFLGLAWALARRSDAVARAALGLLVIAGLLVVPVFLSGEGAEEVVEEMAGVSHDVIEAHEDAAGLALYGTLGLAALALGGLVGFRKRPVPAGFATAALVAALAVSGLVGYVANLGGQIRHPEIRAESAALASDGAPVEHDGH